MALDVSHPRKKNASPNEAVDELRRRAEGFLDELADGEPGVPVPEDAAAVLHELRVHQIELEMQNDELRGGQLELEEQRARYFDLFDLAPVGYVTLGDKGIIGDANLTAAHLLGVQRQLLVGQPFSAFVLAADRNAYYLYLSKVEKTGAPQSCELRLRRFGAGASGSSAAGHFWAFLESRPQPAANGETSVFWVAFTDLTEREQAKEALSKSEQLYRAILDASPDGMSITDLEGRVLMVSRAALKMFGFAREDEMAGRPIGDFVAPEDRGRAFSARALMAEGVLKGPTEYRALRSDGGTFDADVSSELIRDADGRPTSMVFTVRDITARKAADEALRESEGRLRQLVESAHDFIWEVDEGGAYTFVSQQVRDILGYEPEELLGKTTYDFKSPEYAARVAASFADVVNRTEAFREMVTEFRRKDGRLVVLETNGAPFFDAAGVYRGYRGTCRDITERIRAEAALRESEEQHQAILQTAMDGFCLIDMEGRLLEVNEAWAEMSGYSAEELLGMRIHNLAPSGNASDIDVHMKKAIADGEDRFESRQLRKDGSAFDVELSVRVQPTGVPRLAGFIRDITERKQADRLLALQSEILENLTGHSTAEGALGGIVAAIQRATGLDAVGLRLAENDDWPFFAAVGYTDDFLETESTLAVRYPDGGLCTNDDGSPQLECICGLVLRGDSDPADPLFTPGGSVWTNDSASLLALPPEQDPRLHPRNKCIHVGFQSIALIPLRSGDEVFGLLHLADRRKDRFTPDSIHFFEGVCASVGTALRRMHAEEEVVRQKERINRTLASVIEIAGSIGEARDPYNAGHQRRVSDIAVRISQEMGMAAEQIEDIRVAALIHDVGKMAVPAEILSKPGRLLSIELDLIKGHSEAGYRIIASAHMEGPAAEIVYQHHERCDGSGYPRGLKADELIPESKVLMVADVVEALMSHRPYRAALGIDAALAEIERGAGTAYDAEVCRACVAIFREQHFELPAV